MSIDKPPRPTNKTETPPNVPEGVGTHKEWLQVQTLLNDAEKRILAWEPDKKAEGIEQLNTVRASLEHLRAGVEPTKAEKEQAKRALTKLIEAGVDELAVFVGGKTPADEVDSSPTPEELADENQEVVPGVLSKPSDGSVESTFEEYRRGVLDDIKKEVDEVYGKLAGLNLTKDDQAWVFEKQSRISEWLQTAEECSARLHFDRAIEAARNFLREIDELQYAIPFRESIPAQFEKEKDKAREEVLHVAGLLSKNPEMVASILSPLEKVQIENIPKHLMSSDSLRGFMDNLKQEIEVAVTDCMKKVKYLRNEIVQREVLDDLSRIFDFLEKNNLTKPAGFSEFINSQSSFTHSAVLPDDLRQSGDKSFTAKLDRYKRELKRFRALIGMDDSGAVGVVITPKNQAIPNTPERPAVSVEEMDFSQLEGDPIFGPILQEKALEYLKKQDAKYFESEFTGELDKDGYLISRKGSASSNTKPSQNIGSAGMGWVVEETRREAKRRSGASAEPASEEQAPAQNAEVSDEDWKDIAVALDEAQKNIEGWDAGSERNKKIKNLKKIREVLERIHSGNEVSEAEKERTMRLVKVLVEAGVDELAFLLDEQKSAGHVDSAIPEKKEVSQETIDERTRIYDDPTEDPVYELVVNYGNGIAKRRIEEARMDGDADVDSPEFIERANRSAEVVAWGIFSNDYPEKAAAYKNKIPVLKMVMERGMSGGESAPGKKTKQPKGSPVEAPSAAASLGEHDGLTEKIQNGEAVPSWEPGQQVRVLRPDGAVEDGWEVHVVAGDMVSIFSREKNLERTVHVSELAHWQTLDLTPVLESKECAPPTPEAPASVAPSPKKPRAAREPKIPLPEGFKTFSQKFEADFKISEKEFLTIPGYGELTFGQRALVRERFQQVLLGKVHEDAVGTEQKIGRHASGKLSRWASGFMKSYRIADLEKGIADALSQGGIDAHRSTLEQLVATTRANADEASFDAEGNLEVSYLSGFTPENPEQEKHAKRFDEAAERLSQIPQEWSAKTATVSQKFAYWRAHRVYDSAREDMLFIKGVQEGDALKAALWMNKLDERVRMEQLLTTHPKASKELERIKDPDLWMKVLKNASVERLGYFVGGGLSRLLTVSMWGTLGAPVGAGIIGGIRAGSRAKEGLRESDMLARRGVKSKSEMAQNVIDVTKNKTAEKLDRLVDEIAAQTDYVKRSVLATRLRERVKYTQAKLEDGKVNFGVFSERVKNQLNLSQALGRASAALLEEEGFFDWAYADKLEDSVKGYVGMRDKAINKKRRRHMATAITKGAVISAGFGAAGRWASQFVFGEHAHGLFDSHGNKHVAPGASGEISAVPESNNLPPDAMVPSHGSQAEKMRQFIMRNGVEGNHPVSTLTIGARGPEGSIIDYFKDHHDVAKKFGWDGKGDIKKWAGTRAHQLWLEHASKALENDEVKESLTKLGYTNDLEGYTKMMTRIKSGGVILDIEHKGVTLSDMEYLKARSAGVASAEISVPEHVDAPVATPELAASAAVEGEVAQEAATVQPEHPQELTPEEADDHQRWKRGRTIVRAAPTETVSAEDVHKEALGIPFERHSNRSGAVSYNSIPYDRNPEFSRWAGPNGIPFHRSGDYLDMRGVNISAMISEHMDHDLAQVFGETPEGYNAWDDMRDEPVGRFRSLNYKPGSYGDRFKAYLDYLERESGVRPRTHILWFNEKNQNYIRRALGVIERRGLRQR